MTNAIKTNPSPTSPQKQGKVGYKQPPVSVETQFKPGESGHPGGKPKGAKNRLQGDFMYELAESFAKHGKQAIEGVIRDRPHEYLKICASLMPKAVEVSTTTMLDSMSLEELEESLATLKRMQAGDVIDVTVDVTATNNT